MRHIETEIIIAAEPEKVWNVLMDFDDFPNWNPFMKSINGEKTVGGKLTVHLQPPDSNGMTFKPKILVNQPYKEFRWLGITGLKGVFNGEHYFRLEKQIDGGTKFLHGEMFTGLLVNMMRKTLDKTKDGFELMNKSLKNKCEKNK